MLFEFNITISSHYEKIILWSMKNYFAKGYICNNEKSSLWHEPRGGRPSRKTIGSGLGTHVTHATQPRDGHVGRHTSRWRGGFDWTSRERRHPPTPPPRPHPPHPTGSRHRRPLSASRDARDNGATEFHPDDVSRVRFVFSVWIETCTIALMAGRALWWKLSLSRYF